MYKNSSENLNIMVKRSLYWLGILPLLRMFVYTFNEGLVLDSAMSFDGLVQSKVLLRYSWQE